MEAASFARPGIGDDDWRRQKRTPLTPGLSAWARRADGDDGRADEVIAPNSEAVGRPRSPEAPPPASATGVYTASFVCLLAASRSLEGGKRKEEMDMPWPGDGFPDPW